MQPNDQTVRRALAMVGVRLPYVLGAGGMHPSNLSPQGARRFPTGEVREGCDCVGFACWASGFSRFQPGFPLYGGWINTDSSMGQWDGTKWNPASMFFERLDAPVPGCWVVHGSIDIDADGDRDRIGHCGIVTKVAPVWSWETTEVVQCSSGASRATGGFAVSKTSAAYWGRAELYKGRRSKRWGAVFLQPLL